MTSFVDLTHGDRIVGHNLVCVRKTESLTSKIPFLSVKENKWGTSDSQKIRLFFTQKGIIGRIFVSTNHRWVIENVFCEVFDGCF